MQNGLLRGPGPGHETLPSKTMEESGRTALHEAAINGDENTLHVLLSGGADRNSKDHKHGNTPLHEAAWRGYSRCVKALCVLPQPKNNKGIKESKIKGVIQETRGALHSALLGTRNAGGFSALHLAAQNGHNQSCREILLAGADPDVQNNYGDTPLHTACRYGHAGATRILLSAKCDPNRKNLNGDSPLHIACAMGRRKLTKILLEAGCNQEIPNAQNETPIDIAKRKNLVEIVEIMNSPPEIRTPRDRSSSNSKHADQNDSLGAKKKTEEGIPTNKVNWSPYGCHYFPDPRCFPPPKLETLPKEPLKKGEQYFLDLAGNIRKGPIGVGNTCYCGPFFRHIEDRLSRNQKSIRKYVSKATEKLDNKVHALALRTDDQIEQLTKSVIADRRQCEGRTLHLEQWLQRGQTGRLTFGTPSKSRKNIENVNTLTKCRSLELLDEDSLLKCKMYNSRSFDLLEEPDVIVHKHADGTCSVQSSVHRASGISDKSRNTDAPQMRGLGYALSKRLEELLTRTNKILEMEKILRKKRKDASSKNLRDNLKTSPRTHSLYTNDVIEQIGSLSVEESSYGPLSKGRGQYITEEMERFTFSLQSNPPLESISAAKSSIQSLSPEISKECDSKKELQRRREIEQEQSSIISGSSQPNRSSVGSGYGTDPAAKERNLHSQSVSPFCTKNYQEVIEAKDENAEQKFKDLIISLRKDYNSVRNAIENEFINEAIQHDNSSHTPHYSNIEQFDSSFNEGDQSPGAPNVHQIFNGFYQNTNFDDLPSSSNNTIKSEKRQSKTPDFFENELPEMANSTEIRQLKNRILNGSNWRSEVLKQQSQQQERKQTSRRSPEQHSAPNNPVEKVEQSSMEVKTSKSPQLIMGKNKVQALVAKIQGDCSNSNITGNVSESSEDEQEDVEVNPTSNESQHYYNRPQQQVPYQSGSHFILPSNHVKIQAQMFDTRSLVPKDAYFHDLPNKNRPTPVADKIPDIQMLQLSDTFQKARTRNPLPYNTDYDIEIITPSIEHPQFYPPREKLLSNRKFSFTTTVHNQYGVMSINPQLQQPLQTQMTADRAQLERDANNGSGYSTKICGISHGPSPSLSGHTDFSGMGSDTGSHSFVQPSVHHHHHTGDPSNSNNVSYYIGNIGASSLV